MLYLQCRLEALRLAHRAPRAFLGGYKRPPHPLVAATWIGGTSPKLRLFVRPLALLRFDHQPLPVLATLAQKSVFALELLAPPHNPILSLLASALLCLPHVCFLLSY